MPHRTELHAAIRGVADPLAVMDRIVAQAVTLVPGADGASFEVRRDAETLEYVSAAGSLADYVGLRLPLRQSLSGTALLDRTITRTDDAHHDARVNREAVNRTGIRSMLCVPVQGGTYGGSVLKVSSLSTAAFTDADVTTLQRLAGFLDVIISAASNIADVTADLLHDGAAEPGSGRPTDDPAVARFVANVMRPGLLESVERSQRIEALLDEGTLPMVVQPIYALATGEVVAVEALARFPGDPAFTPDRWFASAQDAGLGVALELMALRSGIALLEAIPDPVHLALNVGPETLLSSELDAALGDAPRGRLTIELTEHQRFTDYGALLRRTSELRASGVQVSIDDTGSGYSGLTHILHLRPDILKIDRALIMGIEDDLVRQSLTTALVSFGAGLGAHVVAEGIETAQALARLTALGVRYGQGYHLGRPLPVDEFVRTLPSPG